MIEFKDISENILPYNKEQYSDFIDDLDAASEWNGISIQIANDKSSISDVDIDNYTEIFKIIISKFDKDLPWIINHYYTDVIWFPNDDDDLNSLRTLFKLNQIPNTFKGSIILKKEDLMKLAEDLITYPYILSYRDLDISHSVTPFVIKMNNHLTIDLISADRTILKSILSSINANNFTIKKYRGTSL